MSNQNLRVPFEIPIPGGMSPGRLVILQGTIPPTSRRFDINLLTESGDIALQISPKFSENKIARNSVTHMMYGTEESSGSMPINPGHRFEVLIECAVADFKIAFNNRHFADFNHRLPYSKVTGIGVEGDVEILSVNFKDHGEDNYGKTSNTSTNASYGFQPASTPSNQNGSGGLYPTGSLYPSAPSPDDGYRPSPGAPAPYPSSPSNYPRAPSPGLYPSPNPSNGSPYPSPYPNNPPSPRPPSSGPGFHYPSPGGAPSYPNGGSTGGGGYPSGPSLYPSVPNPGGAGGYPGHGGGSSNRRSSSPSYPTQPGYDNDPYRGSYPHGPQSGGGAGYNPQPHNKPGFFDQAGAALAGVLGPALLSGGMNRRGNPDGRSVLLDQAGRALCGLFGNTGAGGASHRKHNKLGYLGGALGTAAAGAALTGHMNPIKAAKKQLKAHKKALKYGIPIAGAGVGAYVLHKGLKKGFKRSSSSSSCSSSD